MSFRRRHIAKTLSWRIIGTTDTLVISWLITGSLSVGLSIGLAELFSKMFLYYLHERFWYSSKVRESLSRHVFKTFSWRAIGTLDTILLGWLFSGNSIIGFQIGFMEIFTKMILYYLHERLWYRINFGLDSRINRKKTNNFK